MEKVIVREPYSYRIRYINSRGHERIVCVDTYKELANWSDKLDGRCGRGTCAGYIITAIRK